LEVYDNKLPVQQTVSFTAVKTMIAVQWSIKEMDRDSEGEAMNQLIDFAKWREKLFLH
jgi:hypothetical protein